MNGILRGSSLDVALVKDIERRNNKNKPIIASSLQDSNLRFGKTVSTGRKIKIPRDNQLHERSDLDVDGAWVGLCVGGEYTNNGMELCRSTRSVWKLTSKWWRAGGRCPGEEKENLDTGGMDVSRQKKIIKRTTN